jgi:galactokinase/galacturonokinase
VDREVRLAVLPSEDAILRVESLDFPGGVEVDLGRPRTRRDGSWGDYVRAAVSVLGTDRRLVHGFRGVVAGDLPAAGLSSSAALLIAVVKALARVNHLELKRDEISLLVQRAENVYVGVDSGRLDPSIILHARSGFLTHVDCASLEVEHVAWPERPAAPEVLVVYSGVARSLASSPFNTRVAECRAAARRLLTLADRPSPESAVLSDVSPELFGQFADALPQPLRRRAAHFFGEQDRVCRGVDAWSRGDAPEIGRLMTASGASSIENYECGTPEMVTLYELLAQCRGVLGARFSGAGFGGSCVAFVAADTAGRIAEEVGSQYRRVHPGAAAGALAHLCRAGGTATVSNLDEPCRA